MTIAITEKTKTHAVVQVTPDEIAKGLIRENKKFGAASGDIVRLATEAAKRQYRILRGRTVTVEVVPPVGKSGWGWNTAVNIMSNWTSLYPAVVIGGYTFLFSHPCADIGGTLIIQDRPKQRSPWD